MNLGHTHSLRRTKSNDVVVYDEVAKKKRKKKVTEDPLHCYSCGKRKRIWRAYHYAIPCFAYAYQEMITFGGFRR